MKITMRTPSSLIPYKQNTKKHNKSQVNNVSESIKKYGFVQPVVIDKNNVIVIGHCRVLAAKKLKLTEIPCVCVDDLTEEQVKALRIVDNKTNESSWDLNFCKDELSTVDLSDFNFDFNFDLDFENSEEQKQSQSAQNETEDEDEFSEKGLKNRQMIENILNLGYAEFRSDNKDGFPNVNPLYELPEVEEWIPFDWAFREKKPENKGVYFFRDDYRFERVWNSPLRYTEILKKFKAVISPDFSLYYDTPLVLQKFNQYRNRWLSAFWQMNGITVVPLARDSGDRSSFEWCFEGMPRNSWLCFSAMWSDGDLAEETVEAFELMKEKLKPKGIVLYGGENYRDRYKADCPIVYIDSFSRSKLLK